MRKELNAPKVLEVSLTELSDVALLHKWKILACGVTCGFLGTMTSFLVPPVYRAQILMLNSPIEQRSGGAISGMGGGAGGLAALVGLSGVGGEGSQEALAILRSRTLIDHFIVDKNLLPKLFSSKWDDAGHDWKEEIAEKPPTLWQAYEIFDKKIRAVEEDRKSGLVTLSIDWKDPKLAAEWASELVSRANALLREAAIEKSQASLKFLNDQVRQSSEIEVRQAIYKLIESELKREMFARVNEDYAFKIIDPAVVPENKIKPKRMLFGLGGLVLGILLSFLRLYQVSIRDHS